MFPWMETAVSVPSQTGNECTAAAAVSYPLTVLWTGKFPVFFCTRVASPVTGAAMMNLLKQEDMHYQDKKNVTGLPAECEDSALV